MQMSDKIMLNIDLCKLESTYIVELLLSGVCKKILPMSVISSDGKMWGMYNLSGYKCLSHFNQLSGSKALSIISSLIEAIEICKDYLIYPREYNLTTDLIYVNDDGEDLRIAFFPSINANKERKKHQFEKIFDEYDKDTEHEIKAVKKIISDLKETSSENAKMYMETLETLLSADGLKVSNILGFIEELKEEAHICEM